MGSFPWWAERQRQRFKRQLERYNRACNELWAREIALLGEP